MPTFPARFLNLPIWLFLLSLSATPLYGQGVFDDTKYGYQVRPVKGFESIPVDPTERLMVARWKFPRDIRDLEAAMRLYCFERPAPTPEGGEAAAPEVPTSPEDFEASMEAMMASRGPKSFKDLIASDPHGITLGKPESWKVKGPRGLDIEAEIYETTFDSGYSWGAGGRSLGDYYMAALVIRTPTHEWAIDCRISEKEQRKYRGAFKAAFKSFVLTDRAQEMFDEVMAAREAAAKPATAPEAAEAAEGAEPGAKPAPSPDDGYARGKSEEQKRKEAYDEAIAVAKDTCERNKSSGWWYVESPRQRYIVLTNIAQRERQKVAVVLNILEGIRDVYEEDFPPRNPVTAVSVVRICKDRATYVQYGGSPSSAGYWYSAAKELVLYFEGNVRETHSVLRHEAFHQYIFYSAGELSPHSWFNEGYGDYYAGAKVTNDGRFRGVDPFKWRVDIIKEAARSDTHVPIEEIVRYSQGQYYSNANLCYAQGWSLVYFLRTALPKGHPWEKILPTYFDTLKDTKDKDKAVDAAFEGVDFAKLEAAWKAYTVRGTPVTN